MTTYYVAKNGSDSGNGTSGSPWRTISKAMKANLKPGDDVVVRSGIYKEAVAINKDGVTLRSEVPGGANIDPPSGKLGIHINANNVEVRGFEIYGSTAAGINANGVHHVKIIDNIVHDNAGCGILAMKSDYVTIDGNVVYDNASIGSKSGISVFHPVASGGDGGGGFRIIVRNNVSYNNVNKTGAHTDGNGIIIDDFISSQDPKLKPYKYATLVENNLVYQNGGAGILVFRSENITVRGNTAWYNQRDNHPSRGSWRSELQTQDADNVTWINNTAVADPTSNKFSVSIGNFSYPGDKNTGITWKGNVTFNGKPGDDSVSVTGGNAAPSGSNNQLGKNPGLDFSDIKAMAGKLGSTTSTASAAAEKVVVDTASADSDTGSSPTKATDKILVGNSGNNTLNGGAGDDKLTGKAGADKLHGGAGADALYGGNGKDLLHGGTGKDVLVGGAGADKLHGGAGADALYGGNGKDLLHGGTGKDVLVGGAGADDFVFKTVAEAGKGGTRDVIRDFSHAQGDDIDLSGIDGNSKAAGNQAFAFIGDKAFSGKAGQLQYKNGIVAGDVNGDKVADFHIDIANHVALHANDFIL